MTELIEQLNPYMLTCKNISKYTRNINSISHIPKIKEFKHDVASSKNIFIPYQDDKLFWILFYIYKGYNEYNIVGSNSYSIEMAEKINLITELKANKAIFKEYKLNKIQENINEILSFPIISFKTFELICIVKKISILIIKGNMYHNIQFPDTEQVFIIHVVNNIYGCESISVNEIEKYKINRFHIENYDKPLKCVGSFKIDELKELANKLNIEINNKINKQELYQMIQSKINSFFDK